MAPALIVRVFLSWLFAGMVADQYRAHGVGAALLTLIAILILIEILKAFRRVR